MREIKSIDDVRSGDLVVIRGGGSFIRIGDILLNDLETWVLCSEYKTVEGILTIPNQPEEFLGVYDIVEVWKAKRNECYLSFYLEDRALVWKEEQKYYIKHEWLEGCNCINIAKKSGVLSLGLSVETKDYKTQFTELEIEEIKEMQNTTLEDFEIIPVEEI